MKIDEWTAGGEKKRKLMSLIKPNWFYLTKLSKCYSGNIYAITWSFCEILPSSYTEAKKDVNIEKYS